MKFLNAVDPSPSDLIRSYGKAAPRVLIGMIDEAIREGFADEALKLDRARRIIELEFAA